VFEDQISGFSVLRFEVQGSGFQVQGSGFRIQGFGFTFEAGSEARKVQRHRQGVQGSGLTV